MAPRQKNNPDISKDFISKLSEANTVVDLCKLLETGSTDFNSGKGDKKYEIAHLAPLFIGGFTIKSGSLRNTSSELAILDTNVKRGIAQELNDALNPELTDVEIVYNSTEDLFHVIVKVPKKATAKPKPLDELRKDIDSINSIDDLKQYLKTGTDNLDTQGGEEYDIGTDGPVQIGDYTVEKGVLLKGEELVISNAASKDAADLLESALGNKFVDVSISVSPVVHSLRFVVEAPQSASSSSSTSQAGPSGSTQAPNPGAGTSAGTPPNPSTPPPNSGPGASAGTPPPNPNPSSPSGAAPQGPILGPQPAPKKKSKLDKMINKIDEYSRTIPGYDSMNAAQQRFEVIKYLEENKGNISSKMKEKILVEMFGSAKGLSDLMDLAAFLKMQGNQGKESKLSVVYLSKDKKLSEDEINYLLEGIYGENIVRNTLRDLIIEGRAIDANDSQIETGLKDYFPDKLVDEILKEGLAHADNLNTKGYERRHAFLTKVAREFQEILDQKLSEIDPSLKGPAKKAARKKARAEAGKELYLDKGYNKADIKEAVRLLEKGIIDLEDQGAEIIDFEERLNRAERPQEDRNLIENWEALPEQEKAILKLAGGAAAVGGLTAYSASRFTWRYFKETMKEGFLYTPGRTLKALGFGVAKGLYTLGNDIVKRTGQTGKWGWDLVDKPNLTPPTGNWYQKLSGHTVNALSWVGAYTSKTLLAGTVGTLGLLGGTVEGALKGTLSDILGVQYQAPEDREENQLLEPNKANLADKCKNWLDDETIAEIRQQENFEEAVTLALTALEAKGLDGQVFLEASGFTTSAEVKANLMGLHIEDGILGAGREIGRGFKRLGNEIPQKAGDFFPYNFVLGRVDINGLPMGWWESFKAFTKDLKYLDLKKFAKTMQKVEFRESWEKAKAAAGNDPSKLKLLWEFFLAVPADQMEDGIDAFVDVVNLEGGMMDFASIFALATRNMMERVPEKQVNMAYGKLGDKLSQMSKNQIQAFANMFKIGDLKRAYPVMDSDIGPIDFSGMKKLTLQPLKAQVANFYGQGGVPDKDDVRLMNADIRNKLNQLDAGNERHKIFKEHIERMLEFAERQDFHKAAA